MFSLLNTRGNKEVDVNSDKEPEQGGEVGLLEEHHSVQVRMKSQGRK